MKKKVNHFDCCLNQDIGKSKSVENSKVPETKLVTLAWQGSKMSEVIPLPVPYELPPEPYSSEGHKVLISCMPSIHKSFVL